MSKLDSYFQNLVARIEVDETLEETPQPSCMVCGGIGMIQPEANQPLVPCPACERGQTLAHEILVRKTRRTELPQLYRDATLDLWTGESDPQKQVEQLLKRKGKILAFLTCYEFVKHPQHLISAHAVASRIKRLVPKVPEWVNEILLEADVVRRGFVLQGPVGTGKTWLAAGVMNDLVAQGEIVLYMRCQDIIQSLTATWANTRVVNDQEVETQEKVVLDRYKDVPFLFIDDMNLELRGKDLLPHQKDYMESILRHRSNNQMHTFITCNIDQDQFYDQWGSRIADVIMADCQWIPMKGEKFRKTQQKWGDDL